MNGYAASARCNAPSGSFNSDSDNNQLAVCSDQDIQYGARSPNSRSALASASSGDAVGGRLRTSTQRGVHFEANNRAVVPGDTLQNVTQEKTQDSLAAQPKMLLPSKELNTELNICSPVLSEAQTTGIEEALAALVDFLKRSVGQAGDEASGELLPLGSYHLGVVGPTDDLDLLYVVPSRTSLQGFVQKLWSSFSESQEAGAICEAGADGPLAAPGFRLVWRGISVVLLLAHRIPDLPPSAQNVAGFTAREVSEALLSKVPSAAQFRLLLRFVRFWAKRRGVYGSDFGFFSGTAWAICCARICQQHPRLQLPQLVGHFFKMLSRWDWTTPLAMMASDGRVAQLDKSQQQCLMPVLLPVGSGLLATPGITETTMKIFQKELRRGFKTVKQVELARVHWSDVYNSARFFQRHRHYLEFDFLAKSEEVLLSWLAWAKQQVLEVIRLFESTSKDIVALRPWPEWLDFKDAKWPQARAVFMGLHLERGKDGQSENVRQSFDLREPIVKFLEAAATWPDAETYPNQFELEIRHMKIDQLEQWLDNRDKGLVAHESAYQSPHGLYLQNVGEKVAELELTDAEEAPTSL